MCGDEAAAARHCLDVKYPVENGIVRNWDDMEHLWNYTFYEKLQIDPSQNKIMLTEPPMNPAKNREKLVETMFEKYGFAAGLFCFSSVICVTYITPMSVTAFASHRYKAYNLTRTTSICKYVARASTALELIENEQKNTSNSPTSIIHSTCGDSGDAHAVRPGSANRCSSRYRRWCHTCGACI